MSGDSEPNVSRTRGRTAKGDEQETGRLFFDWVSRLFGISLGLAYLVGFLVVTHHLSRYGVSSFSIFHLQYLVAGFWVIAPIVLLASMKKAADQFIRHALEDEVSRRPVSWRRTFFVNGITGLQTGLVIAAFAVFGRGVEGITWGIMASLFAFSVSLMGSADLAWVSWRLPMHAEPVWWANRRTLPFYLSLLLSIFFLYALFFASRLYPLIPYSLGGGKPLTVVFLLGDRQIPGIQAKDGSSRISLPYKLLTTTDRTFIVLSPDASQESIEFNRDTVLGVAVLKAPPGK
jgi:hypothetical protein